VGPERLKAFTDGVFAIIITLMVLELRAPHDAALNSLRPLVPVVLSAAAVGGDMKGKLSPLIYAIAIASAFVRPWIAGVLFVAPRALNFALGWVRLGYERGPVMLFVGLNDRPGGERLWSTSSRSGGAASWS
jgi:hypothetical protein